MAHRAVFLDRDRTIIADPGFIDDPDVVELLPRAADGVRTFNRADYLAIVVSNQSGVARGLFTEAQLAEVHERLQEMLHEQDAYLDAIYYCPFLPGEEAVVDAYRADSDLRKPSPGMLLQAAADHDIDLHQSWMIGDAARDIEAGHRAGCRTILLHAAQDEALIEACQPNFVATNLAEAAEIILAEGPAETAQPTVPMQAAEVAGEQHRPKDAAPVAADTGQAGLKPDPPTDEPTPVGAAPRGRPHRPHAAGKTDGSVEEMEAMTPIPVPEDAAPEKTLASEHPSPRNTEPTMATSPSTAPPSSAASPALETEPSGDEQDAYDDVVISLLTDIRDGLLRQERAGRQEDFSIARLVATIAQVLAICAGVWALVAIFANADTAAARALLAVLFQLVTLTAFVASLRR